MVIVGYSLLEDYNQLLPIFPIGTEKDAQSITPSLDKAIKKGAKAISRHSIFIKGEEHNRWVDDCYLMIAKSYFFQREYVKAIEAFRLSGMPLSLLHTLSEKNMILQSLNNNRQPIYCALLL